MHRRLISLALSGLALASLTAVPSVGWAYDMWVLDTGGGPTYIRFHRVASTLHGTLPTAAEHGEVRVEEHVIEGGGTFPLPVYASDGAAAQENEIFWTVSLEDAICAYHPPGSAIEARFTGRTISASWSSCHNPGPSELRFRVLVVAVRTSGAVAVDGDSFGRIKSAYR